ncbi:MAG: BatD family protein [Dokdonella sp.]
MSVFASKWQFKWFSNAVVAIALLLVLHAIAVPAFAADATTVRAWLDRDSMQLGETVTLNVEASGSVDGQPDFSALSSDFKQGATQSSQQMSFVNGVSSNKTLWAVALEPKHAGTIAIAPITVGSAVTTPLTLNVLPPATSATTHSGDDVFLEVHAEPLSPYVQQQVRYTVKLYFVFDLTDGNLGEPAGDGIQMQRLGQDKRYVAEVGGRRYHVVERHYALVPERSGAVTLPALTFRGSASDPRDPMGMFNRGRAVSATSDAIDLVVRPKPATWGNSPWLPAADVSLRDEGDVVSEVRVGDPLTRTVRIQAQGLGYEQIPELQFTAPAGFDVYPDKPQTQTRDDGTWLFGERIRKFAFVPTKPGKFTLPGMTVRWWNTTTDRAETATLPEREVTVLPASATNVATPTPTPSAATPSLSISPAAASPDAQDGLAIAPTLDDGASGRWRALALLGFALWIFTLLVWWSRSRRKPVAATVQTVAQESLDSAAARASFLRSCSLGELAGAERSLIAWARSERPDVRNLGEVLLRLDDPVQREALLNLQRARYAGAATDGLASALQSAFRKGLAWSQFKADHVVASPLPALYPDRT